MNAVPFLFRAIPAISEDSVEAQEISEATDGTSDGPEDRIDNAPNEVLDGLLQASDDSQDRVVVTAPGSEKWMISKTERKGKKASSLTTVQCFSEKG